MMSESPVAAHERTRLIFFGGAAGIALAVFFATMWIAAAAVNGHWILGEHTLSELGGLVPSRWIFNSAAIVSGLVGIIFSAGLAARLAPSRIGIAGGSLMGVASVGLISVGIFPIDTDSSHTLATIFLFGSAALASFVLIVPTYRSVGAKGAPFIVLITAIVLSFISLVLAPLPLAEAVTVASLQAMVLTYGVWMMKGEWRVRRIG